MAARLTNNLFKFIVHFTGPYKFSVFTLVILGVIGGCYGSINAYLIKLLIDTLIIYDNNVVELFSATNLIAILFICNFGLYAFSWRGINYVNIKIIPEIKNNIIQTLFAYVHSHSYNYFQENLSGGVASSISRVADNIENIVHYYSLNTLRGAVQLILALITMYFINSAFSVVLLIWIICFLTLNLGFSKKVSYLSDKFAKSQSTYQGKIIDSVTNSSNVRLFARENFEVRYLRKYLTRVIDKYRYKEWFLLKLWIAQGVIITILMGVMVSVLINLKIHNQVTVGDFACILGLTIFVCEDIWLLIEGIGAINDATGQASQALKAIVVPNEIIDASEATVLRVVDGEVKFQGVYFKYKKNQLLFENLSVTISSTQRVGLVGYSGSGKTTFANLILRLFDVSSGQILIDNQNIAEVTLKSLRRSISFIPQDPILFHRSLLENIKYGKLNATEEEIIRAAKKANAHEFIMATPNGYKTLVGERGIKLSAGQKQRVVIARAILKNAPIVILDEATSSLDSITEKYIQDSFDCFINNKTVIVIAHRLSTLLSMNRILVFDQGNIVEDGSHKQLLAIKGLYSKLWNSQVDGFLTS